LGIVLWEWKRGWCGHILYFTAGPDQGQHGLFGLITAFENTQGIDWSSRPMLPRSMGKREAKYASLSSTPDESYRLSDALREQTHWLK